MNSVAVIQKTMGFESSPSGCVFDLKPLLVLKSRQLDYFRYADFPLLIAVSWDQITCGRPTIWGLSRVGPRIDTH
jgi:hypothetical protein